MRTKNSNSGLQMGALVCVLFLLWFGTSCSGKGSGQTALPTANETIEPVLSDTLGNTQDSREVTIAKCLSSKGAVLYGASWCPYTKKQISSFKDGFEYLHYVECTEQSALCTKKGVTTYPTWIVGGLHYVGYRAPTSIGTTAGCFR